MKNKAAKPPALARRLLKIFINTVDHDSLLGDFDEMYAVFLNRKKIRADIWYWTQIFEALPTFLKNSLYWSFAMFRNYFKISIRNIVGPETKAGFIPVCLSEARKDIVWEDLEKKRDKKETLNLKVASANKGGLLFSISGIQGFLPVSQLSKKNYPKMEDPTPDKIFQKLQEFVGKEMKVEVITVDKYKNKLIVKEAE